MSVFFQVIGSHIWMLVFVVILSVVLFFFRHIWKKASILIIDNHVRNEVVQNREIHTELVELRALVDADRAYVFRFHNGVEFLPIHSAWKISCTHEVVKHGVSYDSAKSQGLLVSLIPDLIGPVITGTSSSPGTTIPVCAGCPFKPKCVKDNKRVVLSQVEEMSGSYCQYYLEGKNVKTTLLCGLVKARVVFGFVGLDFCGVAVAGERVPDISQKLCRATDRIQYHLQL